MVQDVLGQEGISLEFRHIASYLLWYCQHYKEERELLHLVIILVGYFSALRPDNQGTVKAFVFCICVQAIIIWFWNLDVPFVATYDRLGEPTFLIKHCRETKHVIHKTKTK